MQLFDRGVINLVNGDGLFEERSIIGVDDIDRVLFDHMVARASALREMDPVRRSRLLRGRVISLAFYQPSTRTRASFEAAAGLLGATVTGFADVATTRAGDFYQESLYDVVMNLSSFSDCLVLRHPGQGSAAQMASLARCPVINAGDGYGQHPSQALGDVWTMEDCSQTSVARLRVGLLGDPNVRSLHSIALLLINLGVHALVFLRAPGCSVPDDVLSGAISGGVRIEYCDDVASLVEMCDVIESIGVNHPDHSRGRTLSVELPETDSRYKITREVIRGSDTWILHPGPRTTEIDPGVDSCKNARYFEQVANGMWVRAAMYSMACGLSDREIF